LTRSRSGTVRRTDRRAIFTAFAEACRETGVHAVIGFIERDGSNFYNAAMLVRTRRGAVIGNYRKVHCPFSELIDSDAGDKPFEVFELPFGRIGINICYDASFPNRLALKLLGPS
jgi:predicted amidohydrolase